MTVHLMWTPRGPWGPQFGRARNQREMEELLAAGKAIVAPADEDEEEEPEEEEPEEELTAAAGPARARSPRR